MAGYDPADPSSLQLAVPDFNGRLGEAINGLKIGVDPSFNSHADPEVQAALEACGRILAGLGAELIEIDASGIEEGAAHWFSLTAIEAARHHSATWPARAGDYGPVFTSLLEHAGTVSAAAASEAYTARGRVAQVMRKALSRADLMLCPSLGAPTPRVEDFPPQLVLPADAVPPIVLFQAPFNFSGNPTLSMPMGFADNGMPLSLQLVARHGEEDRLIQVGDAYEQATEWHKRNPEL